MEGGQEDGCTNPLHVHVMRFLQECVSMFFCYYSGVLYNIRYTIPVCSFNELLQAVVKVLAQVLDVNCFDVISKLLPEPTKVFCVIFYDLLTIFCENFMHRGFCPVREQWVKMLAHNYNLSDHWSKDLLFDLFVSHVFCFFLRPFFCEEFGHYSSHIFMWAFANCRTNFALPTTGQSM